MLLTIPEASSTVRALGRALVSVIITLLNDSECTLNKKWRRPVTNKSNAPKWLEIKAKHHPTFSLNCSISYIHTKNIHRHSESWIWKYCVHSPSQKPIIVLVTIFDFWVIHLSTWIASACKHFGERLRSGREHSIALRALAFLNMPQEDWSIRAGDYSLHRSCRRIGWFLSPCPYTGFKHDWFEKWYFLWCRRQYCLAPGSRCTPKG